MSAKIFNRSVWMCQGVLALSLLSLQATASAVTLHAEPADLPNDINTPLDLGVVSTGINTITGGVSGTWVSSGPFSGNWTGDTRDAFAYTVPVGLEVTNVELIVTNFSANVSSVFGEGVSTTVGLDTPFFGADTTLANLLTGGAVQGDGDYVYGLQIANTCPSCFSGNLSYDWELNITAAVDDALLYAEPADLPNDLGSPLALGDLQLGLNKVQGDISGTYVSNGQFSGNWTGDVTDAFEYSVPAGMMVTNFELIITDFTANVSSVFGEAGSTTGGVDTPFFPGDITYDNLLTDGLTLTEGDYDFSLNIADTCPACFSGNLGYDWAVNITLAICGDLDGDGFVGIGDLNIVLSNWNQNVTSGSLSDGDISGDGFVGIDDLNKVLGNWNAGTPPAAQASVPEPTAAGLLMLGMIGFVTRRRA